MLLSLQSLKLNFWVAKKMSPPSFAVFIQTILAQTIIFEPSQPFLGQVQSRIWSTITCSYTLHYPQEIDRLVFLHIRLIGLFVLGPQTWLSICNEQGGFGEHCPKSPRTSISPIRVCPSHLQEVIKDHVSCFRLNWVSLGAVAERVVCGRRSLSLSWWWAISRVILLTPHNYVSSTRFAQFDGNEKTRSRGFVPLSIFHLLPHKYTQSVVGTDEWPLVGILGVCLSVEPFWSNRDHHQQQTSQPKQSSFRLQPKMGPFTFENPRDRLIRNLSWRRRKSCEPHFLLFSLWSFHPGRGDSFFWVRMVWCRTFSGASSHSRQE